MHCRNVTRSVVATIASLGFVSLTMSGCGGPEDGGASPPLTMPASFNNYMSRVPPELPSEGAAPVTLASLRGNVVWLEFASLN